MQPGLGRRNLKKVQHRFNCVSFPFISLSPFFHQSRPLVVFTQTSSASFPCSCNLGQQIRRSSMDKDPYSNKGSPQGGYFPPQSPPQAYGGYPPQGYGPNYPPPQGYYPPPQGYQQPYYPQRMLPQGCPAFSEHPPVASGSAEYLTIDANLRRGLLWTASTCIHSATSAQRFPRR